MRRIRRIVHSRSCKGTGEGGQGRSRGGELVSFFDWLGTHDDRC